MSKGLSRREFARRAALAAASSVVLPVTAFAQQEKPANPPATAAPPAPESPPLSADARAEVQSKYESVLRRYGDRLSPEQKSDIHKSLLDAQKGLEEIRTFHLLNSDEPAAVFRVYRAPAPAKTRPSTRKGGKRG